MHGRNQCSRDEIDATGNRKLKQLERQVIIVRCFENAADNPLVGENCVDSIDRVAWRLKFEIVGRNKSCEIRLTNLGIELIKTGKRFASHVNKALGVKLGQRNLDSFIEKITSKWSI